MTLHVRVSDVTYYKLQSNDELTLNSIIKIDVYWGYEQPVIWKYESVYSFMTTHVEYFYD